MVWGDCYEATYMWNPEKGINLGWMAGLNEDYFLSKCRASPHGHEPKVFDYRALEKNLKAHFIESCTWKDPMCPEGECECCDERRKEEKLFDEYGGWLNMEDEDTWGTWLRENGDDVFGPGWWESVPTGMILSPCIHLHLEGLKRAFKSLRKDTL